MAKLSHLLLYDPDPSGLETLSYVFRREGLTVTGTSDGARVAELLHERGAPLALVALREPEQAGLDLIRDITANPRTRNVACVAIGPAGRREPALQAGAFGLLGSPVFLRDVLDASKLVAAATIPGSRPSRDTDVTIKLSELGGIYYLIRALAAAGRSAAVELGQGNRRGELRFIDGELSSAQLGPLSGLPALHQALLWSEAELRLKFRNVVRRAGQLSLKSDELIEECERFMRDFAHDVKDLGVAGTVYRPGEDARPTTSLPSEVVPLLRLFDGARTLAQVLDESPFRVFDTLRIVHQFAAAGAIRADARPVPPLAGASPGPAALAAWFQRPLYLAEEDRPTPLPEPLPARPATAPEPRLPPKPSGPVRAASAPSSGVPKAARRTPTRRDYPIKNPAAPPPTDAALTPPAELVTPPASQAAAPVAERPRTPSGSVARGEIQTAAPLQLRKIERSGKQSAPSVLVELGAVPQPRAAAPVIEAPLVAPRPATAAAVGPSSPAAAAPAAPKAPAPAPVLRKKTPIAGNAEPVHRPRTPSNGFSAMESDFFAREADLYKGESVESFDDLEAGSGARRDSARKP